jgi:hypothetical protein
VDVMAPHGSRLVLGTGEDRYKRREAVVDWRIRIRTDFEQFAYKGERAMVDGVNETISDGVRHAAIRHQRGIIHGSAESFKVALEKSFIDLAKSFRFVAAFSFRGVCLRFVGWLNLASTCSFAHVLSGTVSQCLYCRGRLLTTGRDQAAAIDDEQVRNIM